MGYLINMLSITDTPAESGIKKSFLKSSLLLDAIRYLECRGSLTNYICIELLGKLENLIKLQQQSFVWLYCSETLFLADSEVCA